MLKLKPNKKGSIFRENKKKENLKEN